jgi:hypothetical protein
MRRQLLPEARTRTIVVARFGVAQPTPPLTPLGRAAEVIE